MRAARGVRVAIPFTRRGCLFSFLAAGLTVLGVARAELGALLCGAGLGAAILLSLIGAQAEGQRHRKALATDPEALEIRINQPQRDEQGILKGSVSLRNRSVPVPYAPGIIVDVSVFLKASNGRIIYASAALPDTLAQEEAELPERGPLLRGVYRGTAEVQARDVFGFCAVCRIVSADLEAVAWPCPSEPWDASKQGAGGESPKASDTLVRGEDRFDARPYVPGDDPRRIHWKQYARFGDLFVRPGDLAPPPRQTLRVFLDTERPPYMTGDAGQAYLDALASGAMGFVLRMRERGRRVVGSAPGFPDAPEDEAGVRRWFADVVWANSVLDMKNPGSEPLILFGAPGCERRRVLFAARRGRGWETVLAVPKLPSNRRSSGIAGLFMESSSEGKREPGRGFRAAFDSALERDALDFGVTGGVDVRVF